MSEAQSQPLPISSGSNAPADAPPRRGGAKMHLKKIEDVTFHFMKLKKSSDP